MKGGHSHTPSRTHTILNVFLNGFHFWICNRLYSFSVFFLLFVFVTIISYIYSLCTQLKNSLLLKVIVTHMLQFRMPCVCAPRSLSWLSRFWRAAINGNGGTLSHTHTQYEKNYKQKTENWKRIARFYDILMQFFIICLLQWQPAIRCSLCVINLQL